MKGRSAVGTVLLVIAMTIGTPHSHASHCVSYHPTNLNLVIDYSGSMEGWPEDLARDVGLGVIDSLIASGNLQRAGGIGFPSALYYSWAVNEGNIYPLRNSVDTSRAVLSSHGSPLYSSLVIAAGELATMPASDTNILIVITDGEGSDTALASAAQSSLLSLAAQKIFVYPSPVRSLPLELFAGATGSSFFTASDGDQARLTNLITERACRNHGPVANLSLSTYSLRLGEGGVRQVVFDASASSDAETSRASLDYEWRVARIGEPWSLEYTGRGPGGSRYTRVFDEPDLGNWRVSVRVFDAERASHEATSTFEILGSDPQITITAPSPVNAGDPLTVRVEVVDPDGGDVEWAGRIHSAPDGGSYAVDHSWDTTEFSWGTTSADITQVSTGDSRLGNSWIFEVNARDNEAVMASQRATVEVLNRPPEFSVRGPETVRVDQEESLEVMDLVDPDGGDPPTINWDVIQSPDQDSDGSSLPAGRAVSTNARILLPSQASDGGSYIFRVTVSDDEGESLSSDHPVFLSVPPQVTVTPEVIRITDLTEPLTLDGSASFDPDSPCAPPDHCHRNLEGPPVNVTGPITSWTWSVLDRPPTREEQLPSTRVAEVFSLDDTSSILNIPPGYLTPGPWTFQLSVEDAEEDTALAEVTVEVLAEGTAPVASIQANPAIAHVTWRESRWIMGTDLVLSASGSYDPDLVQGLSPGEALPEGNGISYFSWRLAPPAGCTDFSEMYAEGESLVHWTPISRGVQMPESCWGEWAVSLEVRDSDVPVESGSVDQLIQITACRAPICLLAPTNTDPLVVGALTEKQAVISFLTGSSARALMGPGNRPYARLVIFKQENPSEIVNSLDVPIPNLEEDEMVRVGWSGRWRNGDVKPGVYSYRVILTERPSGRELYEAYESNAIVIPDEAAGEVIDCADLWTTGFPDDTVSGGFPCVEHDIPDTFAHASRVRIFASPGFVNEDWLNWQYLDWAIESSMETMDYLSGWRVALPVFYVILTQRDVENVSAQAYRDEALAGEPCPIMVRVGGSLEGRQSFKQLMAHEIAHCVQYANFFARGASSRWWVEGSADWISSMVYPLTNREHGNVGEYLHRVPLYRQVEDARYGTSIFFYALGADPAFGIIRVLDLLETLAGADTSLPASEALSPIAGLDTAFQRFARAMRAGGIGPLIDRWPVPELLMHEQRAYGGGTFSYNDPGDSAPAVALAGGIKTYEVQSFATELIRLYLEPGFRYRLVVSDLNGSGRVSSTEYPLDGSLWDVTASSSWRNGVESDQDLTACRPQDNKFTELVVTNTAHDDSPYRFSLRTEVLGGDGC
ncbi:MAG: hypothetical protein HKO64_07705 [Xanthomonadales bacterium]|nr:hypothetical protein [Xanthomonadales bacterium]